jgi:hypothetical protein
MKPKVVKRLPPAKHFAKKILRHVIAGILIIVFSLLIGIIGYMHYFNLGWVDGLYNASMILAGMGPVDTAINNGGKIFASFYAIYSGVAFLTCVAFILSPIVHRFLHKFHIDIEE